ncbi:hypothetical protein BGZ72_009918 [Mortierella alpina]|nr:hypothetical protein BGZ72_009918 [Mortierella alpina]
MLWHLAKSLQITIVLLSTRKKSHVFAVERPHATIGFLHRVDSYHGTSEFLVLTKTRTPPVSRISVDPPLALTYGVDVATIKGIADETNVRPSHNVSKEQCRQGIREACVQVLREMADKKAGDVVKKTKPLPGQSEEQFRKSQGDEFRNTEFSRTRLPRGVLTKSALELRVKLSLADSFTSVTIESILGCDKSNNISIWREVVETQCDGLWDAALKKVEKDQKAAKSKQPSSSKPSGSGGGPPATGTEEADDVVEQEVDKEKENLRTCTVTLRNVLRPDLIQHMDSIVEAVEEKQLLVTDDIADLAVLANMAVLRIAAGDAFMDSAASTTLDVMDLLPRGFQPRCPMSSQVDVAPIPERFQNFLEEAIDKKTGSKDLLDAAGLLSQDFLQYLHTRFLGPRGTSEEAKSKHPLWERIASAIEASLAFEAVKLEGLSATLLEAIREFTTAINNLWEGSIMRKSLDYLLRILLRIHLAPLREQKTRDLKHRKANEKKEAIDKKKSFEAAAPTSRAQRRRWLSKSMDLLDQLSDVLESAKDEIVRRQVPLLLALIKEHQRRMPKRGEQTRLPTIEESLASAADIQDSEAVRDVQEHGLRRRGLCPQGVHEHTADDPGYESDGDDTDSVFGDDSGATVLEMKETDTSKEIVDRAWIRKKAFRGSKFEDAECDVVLQLGKLLGPYVPKRRPAIDGVKTRAAIAHVALRAPLALIANAVLRITGYAEFTRRLAPQISVGARHALAIGAVGVYEVLSGGSGAFVVKDRHGHVVTSRAQITADPENKNAVLGAFFDLSVIDKICSDHGLQFRQRIVYVNRRTVHIVGRVIPHGRGRQGYPVESRLERRKRERKKQPPSHNKWAMALAQLDMSKRAIAEKAEDAKNIKEELEQRIKTPRSQMRSLRAAQTLARREVNRNRTTETYGVLLQARKAVRAARKLLRPKEQELRRARKACYHWNKLERLNMSSQDAAKNITSSTTVSMTTPTWECYTVEDDTEHLNLDEIRRGCDGNQRTIVYAGTDYGVCKMSETVPLTQNRLKEHLQLFSNISDPSSSPPARCSHLPKSNKITAEQVNDISHSRKMGKRREARLKRNEQVKAAYDRISRKENSLTTAVTLAEVSAAHKVRKQAKKIIQPFESSEQRQKDLHTQRLRTERAWTKLGAAERSYVVAAEREENGDQGGSPFVCSRDGWCSDCSRHHLPNRPESKVFSHTSECTKKAKQILPVMVIGDAGTGIGSRIGGHARRGGKKMRTEHMKHGPVVIADENNTSRTCCYCFDPVQLATGRRLVKGQVKMVKIHGTVECVNEECLSFKAGYTMKSRDPHAALAIGLSGTSGLLSANRQVLAPFARGTVASN